MDSCRSSKKYTTILYRAQNSAPSQTLYYRLPLITQPQPTKFTRLRSSTHTRAVSVPVGIATTRGDGVVPVTANLAPPPVLAPREPIPPTAVAVVGHDHGQRADDENAAYIRPPPRLLAIVLPPVCAGSAVSCNTWLLLFKPSHNLAGCPRVRTRGMVHQRSGMRTPRFRMQMSILIDIGTTSVLATDINNVDVRFEMYLESLLLSVREANERCSVWMRRFGGQRRY